MNELCADGMGMHVGKLRKLRHVGGAFAIAKISDEVVFGYHYRAVVLPYIYHPLHIPAIDVALGKGIENGIAGVVVLFGNKLAKLLFVLLPGFVLRVEVFPGARPGSPAPARQGVARKEIRGRQRCRMPVHYIGSADVHDGIILFVIPEHSLAERPKVGVRYAVIF